MSGNKKIGLIQSFKNKLIVYEQSKFKMQPINKFVALFPLFFGPIVSSIILSCFIFIFVTYVIALNSNLGSEDIKNSLAFIIFSLMSASTIFSYLWGLLITYPISKILKHKNNNTYLWINHLITLTLVAGSCFYLYVLKTEQYVNINYAIYILPTSIAIAGFFNTYGFKVFNELIKRDKNGKIIYLKTN